MILKISDDFSKTPGGRLKDEGEFSGEEFRDTILLPAYEQCEENGETLEINFDDCIAFATSFLEEAFGGLVRKYGKSNVMNRIRLISHDDDSIPFLIEKYVNEAELSIKGRR